MNETITVLARAIPEKSSKYGRLVCVAGLTEQDQWRRLYPYTLDKISFRKRDKISVESGSNPQDVRPESRKIVPGSTVVVGQATELEVARRLAPLATSIAKLKAGGFTLGVVKPQLLDVRITVNSTRLMDEQAYLNAVADSGVSFKEKAKLPVQVSYVFKCGDLHCACSKKPHDITIIDWEVNELARNIMHGEADKGLIEAKMRKKLFDFMKTRDLYFILGTHSRWGTWLIVGFFYPPKGTAAQRAL